MRRLSLTPFVLAIAGSLTHAQTFIDNNFDAVADDVGPSFQQINNTRGSGSNNPIADPSTGIVLSSNNNNSAYGLNNISTVDVSSVSGFTMDWQITSADLGGNIGNLGANLWFFGVTDSSATGDAGFYNKANVSGVGFQITDTGELQFIQNSITQVTTSFTSLLGASTLESYEDGFGLSFTLNSDNTFSAFSTGLSQDYTFSGTLDTTELSYASMASTISANTSIQGNQLTYTVDSVTLAATAVPEPSTYALIGGLLAMGFSVIRRRS